MAKPEGKEKKVSKAKGRCGCPHLPECRFAGTDHPVHPPKPKPEPKPEPELTPEETLLAIHEPLNP